jgi:hypothetical protein
MTCITRKATQGNLPTTMTVDNARVLLVATVVVTFTASSLLISLRVYARRRLVDWVCSDWLNGRSNFSDTLTVLADMDRSVGIRRAPSHVCGVMTS